MIHPEVEHADARGLPQASTQSKNPPTTAISTSSASDNVHTDLMATYESLFHRALFVTEKPKKPVTIH